MGKQGRGALAHFHPHHLGATVLPALRERNGLETGDVDDVVWGTSSRVSEQSGDLDLDRGTGNVNGGEMAFGHPTGAPGAILIGTALDELERRDEQTGLITMCAGDGMAPAIIIERV